MALAPTSPVLYISLAKKGSKTVDPPYQKTLEFTTKIQVHSLIEVSLPLEDNALWWPYSIISYISPGIPSDNPNQLNIVIE